MAMGHRPGPRLGEILRALEEEQLSGRLRTRGDARAFVLESYPPAKEG